MALTNAEKQARHRARLKRRLEGMPVAVSGPPASAAPTELTPLAYALWVINDPESSEAAKRDMTKAALPFCHAKLADVGKKVAKKDAAAEAAKTGRFAMGAPPKLVVNNK